MEPLLWWWNKYTAYHGLTLATTPSQTIARLQRNLDSAVVQVVVTGARFIFHRTLRVPEGGISNLPAVRRCAFLTTFRKHDDNIESWNLPFNTRGQQFSRHSALSPRKRRFSDGLLSVSLHNLFLTQVSLQPMFRREAIWLEFNHLKTAGAERKLGPAVKISVGGQFMFFA